MLISGEQCGSFLDIQSPSVDWVKVKIEAEALTRNNSCTWTQEGGDEIQVVDFSCIC